MSTILHPVHHHVRWYAVAAAALATGLLILLMATVFGRSEPTEVPSPPTEVQTLKHYDGAGLRAALLRGSPGQPDRARSLRMPRRLAVKVSGWERRGGAPSRS